MLTAYFTPAVSAKLLTRVAETENETSNEKIWFNRKENALEGPDRMVATCILRVLEEVQDGLDRVKSH